MSKKKTIFFDADGTILDIEKGMTDSTRNALRLLMEKGHDAFLCTGRSRAFVPKQVEELQFTGIIANCGAYLEYKGQRLYNREVPLDVAKKTVEVLRTYGLVPVLEGADYMYYDKDEYTTEVDWFTDCITKELGNRWKPITGNEDHLHFSKVSAKKMPGCNANAACEELKDYYDFIHHEGDFVGKTIEFVSKGCSKGLAICIVCAVLGIEKEDTIAFGDSNNDLAMFEVVKTRVAMENGSKELKEKADYITEAMEEAGIAKGLQHLNLI